MKRSTSILLLVLLMAGSLGMILIQAQNAEALSAVTFTTKTTTSSVTTSQFQRMFENGTLNIIGLDGNSSGFVKETIYTVTSGTAQTLTSALIFANGTTLLLSPAASAASSTDSTGVTWYTQSNGATDEIMFDTGTTGVAQKVVNTASPLFDRPLNSIDLWICEDGNAPGNARIGVFTTTLTEVFLITTIDSEPADCSGGNIQTTYTKAAGTGYRILAVNDRIGMTYNHTLSGLTDSYHLEKSTNNEDNTNTIFSDSTANGAWVDDGTDDLKLVARYLPHLTDSDDGDARSFWRNNVNSESGAYICYDQTSSRYTTGVKVNFPEVTEIPQTLDVLVGSACNSGTDVGNWNTINSAGSQSFNFTATAGRFVTLKVNTWGSDVRFRVGEGQTFIAPSINTLPVSGSVDEQGKYTFVGGRDSTTNYVGVSKLTLGTLGQTGTNIFGTTSMTSIKDVAQSTTNVYVLGRDGSSNLWLGIANRALSTYSETQIVTGGVVDNVAKLAVYEGSPDSVYAIYHTASGLKIVKYTSSPAVNAATLTHSAGDFSIAQLSGKVVVQTSSRLYELNTGTDVVTEIANATLVTKLAQPFIISSSSRTFNTNPVYIGGATLAYSYVPSTGVGARTGIIVNATNAGAGTLTTYSSEKFYYFSTNSLLVDAPSASSTSWTFKAIGPQVQLSVTPYTEKIGVDLIQNDTLMTLDVIRLLCDGSYHINSLSLRYFSVGSDSDCFGWRTLATSGATVGRELTTPFDRTAEPIHTDVFTAYAITLTTPNPASFYLRSSYEDKEVDGAVADLGGQLQQRYLYGQCYDVSIENISNGEVAVVGSMCANDFFTKSINVESLALSAFVPEGDAWYHYPLRNMTNPSANIITYDLDNSIHPWNASVYISDHWNPDDRNISVWHNITNAASLQTIVINSALVGQPLTSNVTIYINVFNDNGAVVAQDVVPGQQINLGNPLASLGPFAGLPIGIMAVVFVALLWRKDDAYIGIVVTAGVAAILVFIGMIPISITDPSFWGAIFVFTILGVFSAKKAFG